MEKRQIVGVFALAMVALLGVGMVSAFGFGNQMSEEDRDNMKNAIESGDYQTWREIKMSQISEEKFEEAKARHQERAEFREAMKEAREANDYSKIQELKEEFGKGRGMHNKNKNSGNCPFAE
jgi:hypothetical protein